MKRTLTLLDELNAANQRIAGLEAKLHAWEETAEHYCAADTPISADGVRGYIAELNAKLDAANQRIAELEDERAIAKQIHAEMKGRLESAINLMSPGAMNHTTGCGESSDGNYWEFSDDARVGDWVAIKSWDMRRGTHHCADMVTIIKITPLRIEVSPGNTDYPTQYWRKHGEAVGNRGVIAAKPSRYDWEIYKEAKNAKQKLDVPPPSPDDGVSP